MSRPTTKVLKRRPLTKAGMRCVYLTPADGCMDVDGERIEWTPLNWEHFEPLLKYLSKEIAQLREFLLEGSNEWTGEDYTVPIYQVGWPKGPKITVHGAKAAVEALRRWYPLRDHLGEGEEFDTPLPEDSQIVLPVRESAPAIFKEWLRKNEH